jgi:hypothetical protein
MSNIQYNKEILGNRYYTDFDAISPHIHSDTQYMFYPSSITEKTSGIQMPFVLTEGMTERITEGMTLDDIQNKKKQIASTAQNSMDVSKKAIANTQANIMIDVYKRKYGIIDGSGIPIYELTGDNNFFVKFVNYTSPNTSDISENTPIDASNVHIALAHVFENQPKNLTTNFIKAILKVQDIKQIQVLVNHPTLSQFSSIFHVITPSNEHVTETQLSPSYLDPDFFKQLEVYRDSMINQLLCFDHPSGCASSSPSSNDTSANNMITSMGSENFQVSCKRQTEHPISYNKHEIQLEWLSKLYVVLFGIVALFALYKTSLRK